MRKTPASARARREAFYRDLKEGGLTVSQAVKTMQKLSGLKQDAFAAHRDVSFHTLRQIIAGTGNPTVQTLNRIAAVYGLEVGFVPRRRGARRE